MNDGLLYVSRLYLNKDFNEQHAVRTGLIKKKSMFSMAEQGVLRLAFDQTNILSFLYFKTDVELLTALQDD